MLLKLLHQQRKLQWEFENYRKEWRGLSFYDVWSMFPINEGNSLYLGVSFYLTNHRNFTTFSRVFLMRLVLPLLAPCENYWAWTIIIRMNMTQDSIPRSSNVWCFSLRIGLIYVLIWIMVCSGLFWRFIIRNFIDRNELALIVAFYWRKTRHFKENKEDEKNTLIDMIWNHILFPDEILERLAESRTLRNWPKTIS